MQPKDLPQNETIGAPRAAWSVAPLITRMSDVAPVPISWLWPSRIALGKVTLIVGDPGLGKSTATLDTAARVSTGAEWPDGSGRAPVGDVVLMSAEDDAADTIRPRLDAANADVSKVHVLEGKVVTLDTGETREHTITLEDLPVIEAALDSLPNCKLLVIDPVSAFMGKADSHKDAEVRGLLNGLKKLAEDRCIAVVVVAHLNKSNAQKALYRISGSLGLVAAARAAWLVVADREDDDKRLLVRVKGNVAADPGALGFRIRQREGELMAAVEWIEGRQDVDLEALLAPPERERQRGTKNDAKDYLLSELADGRRLQSDLEENSPVSPRTLKTAKRELGVISTRPGGSGPWWWELPGSSLLDASTPLQSYAPLHPSLKAPPQAKSELEGKGASSLIAESTDDELAAMADAEAERVKP